MKVAEIIAALQKFPPTADVFVSRKNNDGCGTCGWGAISSECDIDRLVDLETKVVIELE